MIAWVIVAFVAGVNVGVLLTMWHFARWVRRRGDTP